ncbi:MAG: hypothetical protein U0869_01420 [Chloroflexota bacterium]
MTRSVPVRAGARVMLGLGAVLLLTGCGGLFTAQTDSGPALPTPQASYSVGVSGTIALLTAALGAVNIPLAPPIQPARPSEPESLLQAPRAVMQAGVNDPAGGYVVIYQLADQSAAEAAAHDLASYLSSGFGQTNYTVDTQFHVAVDGSTVVFTWWSREHAPDDELAENAFTAMSTVGNEVPVVK